jgi:hypothetical protein
LIVFNKIYRRRNNKEILEKLRIMVNSKKKLINRNQEHKFNKVKNRILITMKHKIYLDQIILQEKILI